MTLSETLCPLPSNDEFTEVFDNEPPVSEGIGISSSFAMMLFIYFFPSLLKFSAWHEAPGAFVDVPWAYNHASTQCVIEYLLSPVCAPYSFIMDLKLYCFLPSAVVAFTSNAGPPNK